MQTATRGTNGRPTTEQVTDPQAAKEARIRQIFTEQSKLLVRLFKEGETVLARAVSSAIMASRAVNPKDGTRTLAAVPAEEIAEKCIACHHMGLEPGADAYLVPYGPRITIIKSPQGLIKLMFNAGWRVEARAVREGDDFQHELGPEGFIRHRKAVGRRDGAVTFGYAFARHVSGGPCTLDVLSRDDIEVYREQSQQKNGPMWSNNYEGAVRKTMIHRIAEYIPLPASLMTSLRAEETGGIEINEEILRALRGKPESAPEVVTLPAGEATQGREPGED
jgi:phage RecT family recombinase